MASGANQASGLPETSYVLLSEFFTWVLDGVARDDAAVKQLAVQQMDRDAEVWGDHFGPDWLSHLLKLIRNGHAAYPKHDVTSEQSHDYNQQAFSSAQRWLERNGGSAEDAMVEVERELARRQDLDPRHIALERLLYDLASAGKLIAKARKWDTAKNCAASEFEPIPADFFLRPCRFFYSVFHGRSELVRWPDDGSPNWLLDSVFNRNDPPVSYVEAKIARVDALALREQFFRPPSRKASRADAENKCRNWLEIHMKKSPNKPQGVRTNYLTEALKKFDGLSKEAFGRAWTQAITATCAHGWSKPGPRSKSTGLKSSGQ